MGEEQTALLEVTLVLPDNLVREAEARGLLTPQSIEALLRAELRHRRIESLFEAADRLAALPMSPLTEAEVEREIQAARTTRRTMDESRS